MTYQLSPIKLQQENYRLQAELTELRSRHEFLQKSESRYRQAFENAPISMLFICAEGKPIEMNSAAEQFLGWTIADAQDADFKGFTNPTLVENGTVSSIKKAIAGEIHDTLAQTFTGISVQLELAQYLSQNNPAEVESILGSIGSLAQTGLAEARRSVWSVYPASEDYTDLAQKLADCVENLTGGTELYTQVRITGDPYPLSCFVGKNLLRIGQESITNTLKHAQATELQVNLTYTPNQVSLCISDNGCGFCPQIQTEGFGLIGISERSDRSVRIA